MKIAKDVNKPYNPELPYLTVRQYLERYHWPTHHAMRNYIYHRKTNGFEKAFFKIGNRIMIDLKEFFNVIEEMKLDSQRFD